MLSDADADGELDDFRPLTVTEQDKQDKKPFLIKLPAMARSITDTTSGLRRSTRNRKSSDSYPGPSGSEYTAGSSPPASSPSEGRAERKVMMIDEPFEVKETEEREYTTLHGRKTKTRILVESDDDATNLFDNDNDVTVVVRSKTMRSNARGSRNARIFSDDDDNATLHYATRSRAKKGASASASPPIDIVGTSNGNGIESGNTRITRSSSRRITRRSAKQAAEDDVYDEAADPDAPGSSEDELDAVHTTPSPEPEPGVEEDTEPKTYSFRRRTKQINYAIPPPIEEMVRPPPKGAAKPSKGKGRAVGWSATGAELSRYMGMPGPGDDSDSDYPTRTPRKPFSAGAGGGLFAAGGGGLFPTDLTAVAGTPSNLGKVSDAALADADPLGVNSNVTFDEVGGLDDHINSLKEMTLLPLLYPEVFQRFNLTPPRGVLFHGPPGTGKTLLARALAASCRSNGRGISFFMRKGADCLSKWVGEAERQLRLLFEEARNQQPSIIFFDEIDGLAPVRSSKQDQIHASIVSTLLALMDGMDGRGQVIVIGATNRPDAVDPALRRPGRFDREFYFPLPNIDARAKILSIITKKWEGWQDGKAQQTIQKLAKTTKGYGGADLRALCTEAALNAVQRRYPQIYKSSDRLLLKPETITVQARDFMISVKKLVPSSARSTASAAVPLPSQLAPLLEGSFERLKDALGKVVPLGKKRTALEEAEFEDEGDEGALEREIMMQKMESLRVYRPRVLLYGEACMGQSYLGAAALHHLEGFHIQTLDLGSLMGDSTRTVEAGIVQLFVEAKRHQPAVVYIPSLLGWCAAVSETARTTVKAMLDSLPPNDPILLLAVVDGPLTSLPRDVRSWFGPRKGNQVALHAPGNKERREFFDELLIDVRKPPNEFPDGIKRRKRVLEELPLAPPLEPRQPTAAELALQEENDTRILTLLKYRLEPILQQLKRKFKRFTKSFRDEYNLYPANHWDSFIVGSAPHVHTVASAATQPNGIIQSDAQDGLQPNGQVNGVHVPQEPELFEVDLESIHVDLFKGKYLTPNEFLDDIGKMVFNAEVRAYEDRDRLYKAQAMFTAAQVSIQEFDPPLKLEAERMAKREKKRREQRKAEKEKEREKARSGEDANGHGSGGENGAPVRRSARNNGQQPEIAITDPLQLERRLKRQRSQDANGESHGSGEDSNDDRLSKRSKVDMNLREGTDHDPLDLVGPTSSQNQPAGVRFAAELGSAISTPLKLNHEDVLPRASLAPIMEVPESTSSTGFDRNLLNPAPGFEPQFPSLQTYMMTSFQQQGSPLPPILEQNMFENSYLPPGLQSVGLDPTSQIMDPNVAPPVSPSRSPYPLLVPEMPAQEPEVLQMPVQPPLVPLDVEMPRSPSPPPPEFYVDEALMLELEAKFIDKTGELNIEQLEELRAASLACIWRHRQEWDRTVCIREVISTIMDFVGDVTMDDYHENLASEPY